MEVDNSKTGADKNLHFTSFFFLNIMAMASTKSISSTVREARGNIQTESSGDGMTVGWMIMTALFTLNELIDYAGLVLNVSGVWEVIILAIDLICLGLLILWKLISGGIKALLNWKIILSLILEFTPVLGDIIPGWIMTMFFSRKAKKPA